MPVLEKHVALRAAAHHARARVRARARGHAQASFEYLLFTVGAILFVVFATVLAYHIVSSSQSTVTSGIETYAAWLERATSKAGGTAPSTTAPGIFSGIFSSWNDIIKWCSQQSSTYNCSTPGSPMLINNSIEVPTNTQVFFYADTFEVNEYGSIIVASDSSVTIYAREVNIEGALSGEITINAG